MAKRKSPKKATKDVSTPVSAEPDIIEVAAGDVNEALVPEPEGEAIDVSVSETAVNEEPSETLAEVETDVVEVLEVSDESLAPEDADLVVAAPIQPEPKQASVLPLIFAGILTAALGFIAARSDFLSESPPIPTPQIDPAIAEGLADVTDRLAALETTVAKSADLDPIAAEIGDLSERTATLKAQVDALAERPQVVDVNVPEDALNAALADLRDTADNQQAEIDELLADARLIRSDTQAEANATLQRAALSRIMSAVDTGSPFAAALGDLEQVSESDVPDALKAAAVEGVIPLAALQESFPDAARNGLAAARNNSEESSGLSGFLQRQLGTRSVEPREGSDPDAVLSRMEAAMRAGHLGDALAEVDQLPEPARDALATWLEQAQSRYDAVSAANALADRLSAL
ncbi:COG4223 family protein [Tateyamaria sp.]|uniref:COG4223 family protein n=1 Tax=Tateyamaria sp. TaxID=1929288 RepID=UPI00329AC80A